MRARYEWKDDREIDIIDVLLAAEVQEEAAPTHIEDEEEAASDMEEREEVGEKSG